ncbi:MAG: glycoside hydrolase family 3 N-terminal domain-containing protein [Planctomycetota bacterium]
MRALAVSLLFAAWGLCQGAPERILSSLTLEQKAGQLFVSWILASSVRDEAELGELERRIAEVGLGGVIASLGTVEDAADLAARLQRSARIPLLLAGDFEGGVAFRFRGATDMGNQMLVGATGLVRLARAMGEVTAGEAKALGYHWVLAPVLDVNSDPANPIINVRSFGEDPSRVAAMGRAFAAGVRARGLIPCGKHFPGHGDVTTDSHLDLPTVPGGAERLRAVELVPFAAACADGLETVMTGHLSVPGLGERPDVPATLSTRILSGVLRGELGFSGAVVTDALDMGGARKKLPPEEVAVRALAAGADVLLMPPDPLAARDAIVKAVREGRVPEARLDEAVSRILRLKQRAGLLDGRGGVDPSWRRLVGTPAAERIADEIAERGMTLVLDREGLLPLPRDGGTLLVHVLDRDSDEAGRAFEQALAGCVAAESLRLSDRSSGEAIEAAARAIREARRVLFALHVRVRSYSGRIGLPPGLDRILAAAGGRKQVAAVSFGNPYLIADLPSAGLYLCAYASGPRVERAAALALRGEAPVTGRLPVSIPGVAEAGSGLCWYPGNGLRRGSPESEGMASDLVPRLEKLLSRGVEERVAPGMVCLVARRGVLVAEVAVGTETYEEGSPRVGPKTLFDLASLTKICATTNAVLQLVSEGRLGLSDPVGKWVPAFRGTGKDRVTVRHLLAHAGGLPSYVRFFRAMKGREAILRAAAEEGLMTEPGTSTTYSDLGFMLLMAVVERASGEPFETYVGREVLAALDLRHARFAPTSAPPLRAMPTEDDPERGGVVRGYVHDENAFAMGGISGHAGLFASAEDVLKVGLCYLGGGRGYLPRSLVALATSPAGLVPGDRSRGLGWQILSPKGWGGTEVPPGTFGHTGFTGTSLWCDPRDDLCVVLLTNRVHPSRVNGRHTALRRSVHDLVLSCIE